MDIKPQRNMILKKVTKEGGGTQGNKILKYYLYMAYLMMASVFQMWSKSGTGT